MTRKSRIKLAAVGLSLYLLPSALPVLAHGLVNSYEKENQAFKLSVKGEELSRQSSFANALTVLKQAAAFDPTTYSERIHLDQAYCYQQLQNYEQAAAEAKIAQKRLLLRNNLILYRIPQSSNLSTPHPRGKRGGQSCNRPLLDAIERIVGLLL